MDKRQLLTELFLQEGIAKTIWDLITRKKAKEAKRKREIEEAKRKEKEHQKEIFAKFDKKVLSLSSKQLPSELFDFASKWQLYLAETLVKKKLVNSINDREIKELGIDIKPYTDKQIDKNAKSFYFVIGDYYLDDYYSDIAFINEKLLFPFISHKNNYRWYNTFWFSFKDKKVYHCSDDGFKEEIKDARPYQYFLKKYKSIMDKNPRYFYDLFFG